MGNLKRLEALWLLLATNTQLSAYVEDADKRTFVTRVQGEGITFLTVVLPRLYKTLDRAFATGVLTPVEGFSNGKKGCVYPLFLRKAWMAIFNEDGTIKPTSEVCVGAVACIRQLSAIFYKLELQYTDDQINKVIDAFKGAEADLVGLDLSPMPTQALLNRARRIVTRLLCRTNPFDIRPRHGTGASACQVKPWLRYDSYRYIRRLDACFPYENHFHYNLTDFCDNLARYVSAEEANPPARVVLVPKDSRGPRLISCEPREFMFIQKGLMDLLYNSVHTQPGIAAMLGFNDQTRNQVLAKYGSLNGSHATLDLKEASDRVSMELVRSLFPSNWVAALEASRSESTILPDGTVVPLRKFAPMGSACCFPVEAICFWAISLAAIGNETLVNRAFRNQHIETEDRISVFGDDIIVPTRHAEKVILALESCGLVVNRDKSFWNGPFRESCGVEAFNGIDVTPVRVKNPLGDDEQSRFRAADMLNNMIGKYGYARIGLAAQCLYETWYGPIDVSSRYTVGTGLVGFSPFGWTTQVNIVKGHQGLSLYAPYTDAAYSTRVRFNKHLCLKEYRIRVEQPRYIQVALDRWSDVHRRDAMRLGPDMTATRCALARRVQYKYSWVSL